MSFPCLSLRSIREIEVIVSVGIVFTLAEERSNQMEREWKPSKSNPHSEDEVDHESLDEELIGSTVEEVEEPLLGGV